MSQLERNVRFADRALTDNPGLPDAYAAYRSYLQIVTNKIFLRMDDDWYGSNSLGSTWNNKSSLDWSKDEGACESGISALYYLQEQGLLSEGAKVLDMGANYGDFLLLLRPLFPNVDLYGIELQPFATEVYGELVTCMGESIGRDKTENLSMPLVEITKKTKPPTVATGNFFGDKSAQYPFESAWGYGREEIDTYAKKHGAISFEDYLSKYPDPYESLGVSLEEFDVVYMYQFDFNTEAITDFAARNCKPGAYIIINHPMVKKGGVVIPPNLLQVASVDSCMILKVA